MIEKMSKAKAKIIEYVKKHLEDEDKIQEIQLSRQKNYDTDFNDFRIVIEGCTEESD